MQCKRIPRIGRFIAKINAKAIRFGASAQDKPETLNEFKKPHDIGQSLWIQHITREQLYSGLLKQYIEDWRIAGLTVGLGACEQVWERMHP